MKIAIAGYSGFIGKQFMKTFPGNEYVELSRDMLNSTPERLAGIIGNAEVVLSLTGYPIVKRWSGRNRKLIKDSRSGVNRRLVRAIYTIKEKPALFISASAIGIYSDTGKHDEGSKSFGTGFMAEVVREWEKSTEELAGGTRVVSLRIGMVLGNGGGAFPTLRKLTQFGLGGILGSGKQICSYIHIEDLVRAIDFIILKKLEGPVNIVNPDPVDNYTLIKTLGKVIKRPVFLRIPALALFLLFGKAARVITGGQYVVPGKLTENGFEFKFSSLEGTISNLVSRP